MSFIFLALLPLLLPSLLLCQPCQHGKLPHCTCLNVSQSELQCQDETNQQFVYQSQVSETLEVMSLQCGRNVDASILESMARSQLGEQTVSVKMVGCDGERLCTPVQPPTFSIQTLFYDFFSFFSYTHTKGRVLKDLDLIGCTHLENIGSLDKIKNITNAEAINIFHISKDQRERTFKKYIYFPTIERRWPNSTNQRQIEGINVDLSERSIVKLDKNAFWSEESYQIEMLNLSHNSISEIDESFFPNSTFSTTKYLDLSFNKLSSLRTNVFQNLTSVADLNLAGNKLTVLSNGIFVKNPLEVRILTMTFDQI